MHVALLDQAFAHCPIFPTAATRRCLARISVPVWGATLSGPLPVRALVGHYPTNKLMGRRPLPKRITPFIIKHLILMITWGISSPFELLSPSLGQVTNALRTRSPLRLFIRRKRASFDLHVLSTPPAFILSQDQTLRKNRTPTKLVLSLYDSIEFWFITLSSHSSVVKVPYFDAGQNCNHIS